GDIQFRQGPSRRLNRPVVLGQTFENFPAQVEPRMRNVRAVEPHHDAKRMLVVRVAPLRGESGVERLFTAVPERRVADVMRQAQCLREILVEAECPGDDSPDLGNLKAMRQANPEMVAVRRNENLGLSGETPERDRMDDAVAVALERAARTAASFVLVGELA